jgi:hypothetical protein
MEVMMKIMSIVLINLVLLLLLNASLAYSLTIIQPANNSIFFTGQAVKVVVEAAPDENIAGIIVSSTSTGSSTGVILKPPFEFELRIGDQYVGNARIRAVALLKDETAVETGIDVTIQLKHDVILEKLETSKSMSIQKSLSGKPLAKERIQIRGMYSDGIRRDINILNNVAYISSDPTVASVDNQGIVTAQELGWATISISAGDKKEIVKVHIYINIDIDDELLVKPTDTGIQLGWKLSPQDPEWVTGYMVFRTEDPDGIVKTKIADLPKGTTTYVDTTAEKGKTYYYGVQAISTTANERSSMTNMTPGTMH